jgi:hypothetical protein
MNIFDAFPGNKRIVIQRSDADTGTYLIVEVATSETHSMNATATKFPVESGVNISDHILNQGVIYEVSGLISDDPIDFFQKGIVDRFKSPFIDNEKVYSSVVSQTRTFANDSPSKNAFYLLNILYYMKIPVNIVTDLTMYKNMVMESLIIPRDQGTTRALKFEAKFREVLVAQIKWTENLAEYDPRKPLSKPQSNEGGKDGVAVSTESQSAFYNIFDFAGIVP